MMATGDYSAVLGEHLVTLKDMALMFIFPLPTGTGFHYELRDWLKSEMSLLMAQSGDSVSSMVP